MTEHAVGTQEEWQVERDRLLAEEKEITRATTSSRRSGATSLGAGREGVQLRDGRWDQVAGRALRRKLAAAHLPLHVRASGRAAQV